MTISSLPWANYPFSRAIAGFGGIFFNPLLSINALREMILPCSILKKQDIGQVSLNRDIEEESGE